MFFGCFGATIKAMITETELKDRLAKNLAHFRKTNNMTQQQLAEKINYSDKSVSKWERKESIPDIMILIHIADVFGVSLDDLLASEPKEIKPKRKISRYVITLICFTGVWMLATLAFTILNLIGVDGFTTWLVFIYAIPASIIILVIFSQLWGSNFQRLLSVSLLLWSVMMSIYLSFDLIKLWLLFVTAAPVQILFIFWYILKDVHSNNI